MQKHEKAKLSDNSLIAALPLEMPAALLNEGRCTKGDEDPRLWDLAVDGESPIDRHHRRSRGAEICRTECPVREQCLKFADATRLAAGPEALTGVWGGLIFSDRDVRGRDGDARFQKWPKSQLMPKRLAMSLVEVSSISPLGKAADLSPF